jgi:hypothetical protein
MPRCRRAASSRHGAATGCETVREAGGSTAQRAHGCRGTCPGDTGHPARAVGRGGTTGDGSASACGAGDHAACGPHTTDGECSAGGANSSDCHAGPDGRTCAKLWSAGDEAIGDTRAEDGEAEQRQCRKDQGQRVADGGWVVEATGELSEDR